MQVLDKRLYALLNAKRGSSGGWHTLRQELAILESINHPNLIRLKRLFEDDTAVHVVTDYLAGGTLLDHLTRISRPLAEAEARTVMHQIFKALSYLHKECHIVHRDIKVCLRARPCAPPCKLLHPTSPLLELTRLRSLSPSLRTCFCLQLVTWST